MPARLLHVMKIRAHVQNGRGQHHVTLRTNNQPRALAIAPRPDGRGSSVNGGELLFLALATCYCNDLYREAARRHIDVVHVDVEVSGVFGAEGTAATNLSYRAKVTARAPADEIRALMIHTDTVAEVQNTLRAGTSVVLESAEAISV